MLKRKFVIGLAAAVLSITVIFGLNSAIQEDEQPTLNNFSELELNEIQEKLRAKEHLGVTLTAIKVDTNKVDIYISEENYKKNKNDILDGVNPSAVHFIFGDFKVVDQAAYLPGEQ